MYCVICDRDIDDKLRGCPHCDELIEDASDLAEFDARKKEPSTSFDDFVKELNHDDPVGSPRNDIPTPKTDKIFADAYDHAMPEHGEGWDSFSDEIKLAMQAMERDKKALVMRLEHLVREWTLQSGHHERDRSIRHCARLLGDLLRDDSDVTLWVREEMRG